jgi:thiol-disulfide isomerase/thioredoxin
MDRLPALRLLALVALLAGCPPGAGESGAGAAPASVPPSRVDAVAAAPKKETSLDEFCDVRAESAAARTFAWPELDAQGPPAPAASGAWTWVNVWATWCVPCLEEMPLLAAWESKLQADLGPGAVRFLSVDETAEQVATFRGKHPGIPDGPRIRGLDLLEPWLLGNGLDKSAVLPIHLFLDAQQRIRCVRMGAVAEKDYGVVKRLLSP